MKPYDVNFYCCIILVYNNFEFFILYSTSNNNLVFNCIIIQNIINLQFNIHYIYALKLNSV